MPPSETPGQAKWEHASHTNHQQSDDGDIIFQESESQEILPLPHWGSVFNPLDFVLLLTFKAGFAVKPNSTLGTLLAAS